MGDASPPVARRSRWAWIAEPPSMWACVAFGVVAPAVCFALESSRLGFYGGGPNGVMPHPEWTRPLVAVEVVLLAAWLCLRGRLGVAHAVFGGVFFVGGAYAACLGVALLPMTLIAILLVVGFLGFVPFLTAVTFARCARDAWRSAEARGASVATGATLALVGAAAAVALPVGAASLVERRIKSAAHDLGTYQPDDATGDVRDIRVLSMFPGASVRPLVARYDELKDETARARLDGAFRDATGESIDEFRDRSAD